VFQTETGIVADVNHLALAWRWKNIAAAFKIFPSGADLAAPLSSQSYAKPEFIGPQTRGDGKDADTMSKDFRALLNNTQHATHRTALYSGTFEFMKHKSRNKMYQFDEQLHAMELGIYHCIQVQVDGLQGERKYQI